MFKKILSGLVFLITGFWLLLTLSFAQEESITITTYYPSPYGSYRELRSQRMAAGSTYYDSGSYPWDENGLCMSNEICNADFVVEGNVGIGTKRPGAKLDVQGGNINASGKLQEGGNALIPAGTVMFFNLVSCPAGWSELVSARGRYIVGLPFGGTVGGTVGTALSNQENRPVGSHSHAGQTSTAGSHTHTSTLYGVRGGNLGTGSLFNKVEDYYYPATSASGDHQHSFTTDVAGAVPDTNAPYIQLLVCQKI